MVIILHYFVSLLPFLGLIFYQNMEQNICNTQYFQKMCPILRIAQLLDSRQDRSF